MLRLYLLEVLHEGLLRGASACSSTRPKRAHIHHHWRHRTLISGRGGVGRDPWLIVRQRRKLIHIESKREGDGGHAFVSLTVLLKLARLIVDLLHAGGLVVLSSTQVVSGPTRGRRSQSWVALGPAVGVV